MQYSAYVDVLKERYRFDEWKDAGRATAATEMTQALSFSGNELPGWRLARQTRRAVQVPGARSLVRSTWEGSSRDQLLGVDVFECDSPAAAREALLHVLGEFQGPTLSAVNGIGDVAFGTPGETAIVFARGNAVAAVRNAGRRVGALGDVARALDALLSPRQGKRGAKPTP
ncbi:MAG: hypothetical protein ACREOG_05515 [Gemmatimonadaceae bacterium]